MLVVAAGGCGKQLNPDFCDAHPADDRCLGGTGADGATKDAGDDATTIDAAPIEGCPVSYDLTVTGSTSRYRKVDTTASWASAAMDCGDDLATGPYTHLVVLSNPAERTALDALFDRERHVGHSDIQTEDVWLPITVEPNVYPEIQSRQAPPWAGGEPNDSGNCAVMDANLELRDRDCTNEAQAYLCECDAYTHDLDQF